MLLPSYYIVKLLKSLAYQFLLFIVLIASIISTSFAQSASKQINHQYQSWGSMNVTTAISPKWAIISDMHMRRNDFLAKPSFYFLRAGLQYKLKDKLLVAAGYGHMWIAPVNSNWSSFVGEHRLYQQIQFSTNYGRVQLLQRLRNELRWQQKIVNDPFTGNYKFTSRLRYLLSINLPVFKNTCFPSLVVSDEIICQMGKEVVLNPFDQNRFFIGIKQFIHPRLSFDMGYMLVNQQKSTGYQYDRNHTLRLFFYYNPVLKKK